MQGSHQRQPHVVAGDQREECRIEAANKLLIAGLAFLALAILGAVLLITDYLFDGAIVWIYPSLLAVLLLVLWFVIPLARRLRAD